MPCTSVLSGCAVVNCVVFGDTADTVRVSNRVATKLRILEVVMAVRFLVAYCLPDSALFCFPCIETVAEANAGLLFLCFFSLIEQEYREFYHQKKEK